MTFTSPDFTPQNFASPIRHQILLHSRLLYQYITVQCFTSRYLYIMLRCAASLYRYMTIRFPTLPVLCLAPHYLHSTQDYSTLPYLYTALPCLTSTLLGVMTLCSTVTVIYAAGLNSTLPSLDCIALYGAVQYHYEL
jgi:hypothetical protein